MDLGAPGVLGEKGSSHRGTGNLVVEKDYHPGRASWGCGAAKLDQIDVKRPRSTGAEPVHS
jgi:hypothetical protein